MSIQQLCDSCGESFPEQELMLIDIKNKILCEFCINEYIEYLYKLAGISMKIKITKQTKIWFRITADDKRGHYKQYTYATLKEARDNADWCENNGFTNIKLELIAES